MNTHDETTNPKAEVRKQVDRILDIKNEKDRLREAYKYWLSVNPKIPVSYSDGTQEVISAQQAHRETLKKIRYLKDQHETSLGLKNKEVRYKGVGTKSWRSLLEFPPGSIDFMRMFAIEVFNESGDRQRKAAHRLTKIFPEFVTPEVV